MAAKTTEAANAALEHILNNAAWANIGDAAGLPAGTAGSLWVSLHTADPGVAGDQTTSEIAYTGYGRVAVARDGTKWTVAAGAATNAAIIAFGACAAGSGTATYAGIGTANAGAGHLVYRALVTNPPAGLAISAGITPSIAIGAAAVTES